MLSYIYRLFREFELHMGYAPNVLFINHEHMEHLKSSFETQSNLDDIRDRLGLEILLRRGALHPSVNWVASAARKTG